MPRAKPHFKIFTTSRNHRKLPAYADNDLFALWARLGVEAIERFADRTGDTFVLHEAELAGVAGGCSRLKAIKLLSKLTQCSPITFTTSGKVYAIHFPNLAKKHGFKHQNSTLQAPNADADPDAVPTPPLISPPRLRRSDKPPSRKPAFEKATCFPKDGLSPEQKAALAASPTLKDISPAQFQHACQIVQDWSTGDEKGPKKRSDWVATIRNAINRGWALEGMPGVPRGTPPRQGSTGPAPRDRWSEERKRDIESGDLRPIADLSEEEIQRGLDASAKLKERLLKKRTESSQAAEADAGETLTLEKPTDEEDIH